MKKLFITIPVSFVDRVGLPVLITEYKNIEVKIYKDFGEHCIITYEGVAKEGDINIVTGKPFKLGEKVANVRCVKKEDIVEKEVT